MDWELGRANIAATGKGGKERNELLYDCILHARGYSQIPLGLA